MPRLSLQLADETHQPFSAELEKVSDIEDIIRDSADQATFARKVNEPCMLLEPSHIHLGCSSHLAQTSESAKFSRRIPHPPKLLPNIKQP